jgi:hypothetical protein
MTSVWNCRKKYCHLQCTVVSLQMGKKSSNLSVGDSGHESLLPLWGRLELASPPCWIYLQDISKCGRNYHPCLVDFSVTQLKWLWLGVCCQFVNMGLTCTSTSFVTRTCGMTQATAFSVQCCEQTHRLAFGSRDVQDVLIYGCISILILMYLLHVSFDIFCADNRGLG